MKSHLQSIPCIVHVRDLLLQNFFDDQSFGLIQRLLNLVTFSSFDVPSIVLNYLDVMIRYIQHQVRLRVTSTLFIKSLISSYQDQWEIQTFSVAMCVVSS